MKLRAALFSTALCFAQQTITIRPVEIDDVLVNPGMGFSTFQRFNGDQLNSGTGWTEGLPIEYQPFRGTLHNPHHPDTSVAYFRVYWRFVEPQDGAYNWDVFDKALRTAHSRGQTLMVRIAPYGTNDGNDVPDWYRALVGPEKDMAVAKWRTNPEDPRYAKYFTRMIRAFASRYDGDPDLESVDVAIVGAWGEGAGSEQLTQPTRAALMDAYADSFSKTPLLMMLTDPKTNGYGLSKRPMGWRADCLGDMGGFSPKWSHMLDLYPEGIIRDRVSDAWKQAPVSFEVCWVLQRWKDNGWDVNYIVDQSLKWHISTFNAKSSPVPDDWQPVVDRWLKRMGYRFVLRKLTVPESVHAGDKLSFETWWENKGVAPCYKNFRLAFRLKNAQHEEVFLTDAKVQEWLPGDSLYDGSLFMPRDLPAGNYELAIALVDEQTRMPRVNLAIKGRAADGWYPLTHVAIE